ncbi:MAG: hypothetical protein MUC60_09705 [Oscillatoria sp. Prado101]|nr:hypothetical protein [Oscillatoria sp. Prado101]
MISVSAGFLTDKSYLNPVGTGGVLGRCGPGLLLLSCSLPTGAFAVTALQPAAEKRL